MSSTKILIICVIIISFRSIEFSNAAPKPTLGLLEDALGIGGTDVIASPYYGNSGYGYGKWKKM